ncbi:hypothetical protein JCM16814_34070 [Desulfobaculum senezii]
MLVAERIHLAQQQYNDLGGTGVPVPLWGQYLNAAQRQVALQRPDASSAITVVRLAPGVLQEIPDDGVRLLDVLRNMGADGATPGTSIQLVDKAALDAANLAWPAGPGATAIDNWAFSDLYPRSFWVSPPVSAVTDVYVEIGYAVSPADVPRILGWAEGVTYAAGELAFYREWAGAEGVIFRSLAVDNVGNAPAQSPAWWVEEPLALSLPDIYAGPVVEWMLRMAFLREDEGASTVRAAAFEKSFYQSLGIKTQTDIIISPNNPGKE